MDLLDYKIGSLLRLEIYDDNDAIIEKDFVSQFEESVNAYEAYIAAPIVEGVIYAVRAGWTIVVYMQDGNNFYRFQARVTQRLMQDGRPVLRISRQSEIAEAQRRKYYRFKYSAPLKYRVISFDKKDEDAPFLDSKTVDISGSGLCFTSDSDLKKNNLIECELTIDRTPIYMVGQIMRCLRITDEETERISYQIGVRISEIEEPKREQIIRFIFYEERKQLRMRAS